jgi:hypothetical protein
VVVEGTVLDSVAARHDFPFTHDSHDWCFFVKPDPGFERFLSDTPSRVNGQAAIEMEWEIKRFPLKYRPMAGDHAWVMGRWVFDCGHPEGGYRTEIHPPRAVAFTRLAPTFFAGDDAPSLTNRTFVFIHGKGGYFDAPVGGRDYEFDIPLPRRPSPAAQLRTRVLDTDGAGSVPTPILTPLPSQAKVRFRFPLASRPARPDQSFGAVVACGWREPTLTQGYRQLEVIFESVRINRDHDPLFSGEWHLFAGVNGSWIEISGLGDVDDDQTVAINRSVRLIVPESGALRIQTTGWEGDAVDDVFGIRDDFSEGDAARVLGNLLDDSDPLGFVRDTFSATDNFGIGPHNSRSRRLSGEFPETAGDFNLRYRVREVRRFPPGTSL